LVVTPNLGRMNPAALVREVLADHKAAGVEFEVAWKRAYSLAAGRSLASSQWRAALEWARPAFEAAYEDADQLTPVDETALVA
jgi:hypothetical protein